MDYEKIVRICSKRLKNGETYRELREELFERYYPEDALQIATESYRGYRKEKIKSFFKNLFIYSLVLVMVYFIAPPNHALKPKIGYIIWFFLIAKSLYDWYNIRKLDKEYQEETQNS